MTTVHRRILLAFILWALPMYSHAQSGSSDAVARPARSLRQKDPGTINRDDGLAIIAAALDLRAVERRERDCSHLVHAIYDRAGFSYPYASSSELYQGTDSFRRVSKPQPGDLVVWEGHVGIVVNPARKMFFSFLSQGPAVDLYNAQYWKERGPLRFYRFVRPYSQL